jgi:uncharacterized protein YcfL
MRQPVFYAASFTPWVIWTAIMFCVSGCHGPVVPGQNTLAVFPQVHLASYSLQGKITIQAVPVRNMTGDRLYLEYQYYFLNHQGVQVEENSGWNTLRLPPYSVQQIQFSSLTAEAYNFDLDIRRLP